MLDCSLDCSVSQSSRVTTVTAAVTANSGYYRDDLLYGEDHEVRHRIEQAGKVAIQALCNLGGVGAAGEGVYRIAQVA